MVSTNAHGQSPHPSLVSLAENVEGNWHLSQLTGRLSEVCGSRASAVLTAALQLVLEAQHQAEPTAWITDRRSCFYPPDAAESGVDLDALAVVRVPQAADIARAADQLARSGAFGLLVLDLHAHVQIPSPLLSRLLGLAQKHGIAILCLRENSKNRPTLGSLVSLRAEARRFSDEHGKFVCELHIVKDKRRAPGWSRREVCRGPVGLR